MFEGHVFGKIFFSAGHFQNIGIFEAVIGQAEAAGEADIGIAQGWRHNGSSPRDSRIFGNQLDFREGHELAVEKYIVMIYYDGMKIQSKTMRLLVVLLAAELVFGVVIELLSISHPTPAKVVAAFGIFTFIAFLVAVAALVGTFGRQ